MSLDTAENKRNYEWKEFEAQVLKIFDSFDYEVKYNVRFKTKKRYQIDLIAYNEKYIFFIDCKDHKYISSYSEREFIKKQVRRMHEFLRINKDLDRKERFILLVTKYRTPSLLKYNEGGEKILSINIESLNDLLNNIEIYKDALFQK